MSSYKTRIGKIEKLRERLSGTGRNWQARVARFQAARERGNVLCKDGKERTVPEWLKTLDPTTAAQILNLGITSREQGSEKQE